MEDLPLGRIAALVPEFAVKDLPLGRTLIIYIYIYIYIYREREREREGGGRRVIVISGSLIWSKTLMELIFNPCGEFR